MFRQQVGLFDANGFGAARDENYLTASRISNDVTVPYYNLRTTSRARYVIGNAPGAERTLHVVRSQVTWDGVSWMSLLATASYTLDRGNLHAPRSLSTEWFQPSSSIHSLQAARSSPHSPGYGDTLAMAGRAHACASADL